MNIVLFFDLKIGGGNNVSITPIIKKLKDKSNKFIESNFIKKRVKNKDEYDRIIRKKIKQKMYKWMEGIGSLVLEEYNFRLYIPTEKFICSIYDKFIKGKIDSTKDINLILDDITELFDTIGVNKVNESISIKTVSIVENILLDLNIIKFNRFIEIDSKFYADKIRKKVFNIYKNPIVINGDNSEFYIKLSNFYYVILVSRILNNNIYIPRIYYQSKNKNVIYYRDIDTLDRYNITDKHNLCMILYQTFKNVVYLQEEQNVFVQYLFASDIRISDENRKNS